MERGNSIEASALLWWADAGVDTIVGEEPRDWLREKSKTAVQPQPSAPAEQGLPDQLELFRAYLKDSDTLPFSAANARRVCPSGDPASGLMMVADMPAAEDCASGTLLSGEAGRLFDRMLAAMGRDRETIYLASLSCLRSPDGRFTDAGSAQCATLARHHIGLAAPKALLLLGDSVAKALLGLPVMSARGRWHELSTHAGQVPAMVTFAPTYLLDRPAAKAAAWLDLQMLMERLNR